MDSSSYHMYSYAGAKHSRSQRCEFLVVLTKRNVPRNCVSTSWARRHTRPLALVQASHHRLCFLNQSSREKNARAGDYSDADETRRIALTVTE